MKTWTSYTVVAATGETREFYCFFRATEFARKVNGTINGREIV